MSDKNKQKIQETARVVVVVIFILLLLINWYVHKEEQDNRLILTQSANSSSGSYWECELSEDGVLQEVDYYTKKHALNFGPGYQQSWVFEPVSEGEVTIKWFYYEGDSLVEGKSYEVTYSVDEQGNWTLNAGLIIINPLLRSVTPMIQYVSCGYVVGNVS